MKPAVWQWGDPDGACNGRMALGGLWTGLLLAAACAALAVLSLRAGALPLSLEQLWQALQGQGGRLEVAVVQQWRSPRVLMALVVGAALGMSGAIFQS